MKHVAMIVIALALACPALLGADNRGAPPAPGRDVVVVDPLDLRQPVPDPEQGLTQKYDGRVVAFTGAVHRSSVDKKTKKHSFELVYEIVHQEHAKGKKPRMLGKETIVVPVNFQKDAKGVQGLKQGAVITVEGTGSVTSDGTLIINDAVIVSEGPAALGR